LVSITKWIIIGGGLIMLGLFTKEAAATSLTATLQRTGMAGGSVGSALSGIGGGIADFMRGLFTPLWEVGNFAKSFGMGSDYWGNSTPDIQAETQRIDLTGQGGGFIDAETQGGGDPGFNTDPISDTPTSPLPLSLVPHTIVDKGFGGSVLPQVPFGTITGSSSGSIWSFLPQASATREVPTGWTNPNAIPYTVSPISDPLGSSHGISEDVGGGSNNTTGMGAASGSNNPLARAQSLGYSMGVGR
jgi:hypothetical protein